MEEIKQMLREVLKEELAPINRRLDSLETRLDSLETRLDSLETRLDSLETRMESFETRMESFETRMDGLETRMESFEIRMDGFENRFVSFEASVNHQFSEIRSQLDRMERRQNEDVIGVLRLIDSTLSPRLDQHEHRIELLNERLLNTEADVRKLISSK
jgi:chromosome segregation ATPase